SFMEITGVSPMTAIPVEAPPVAVDRAAENREVIRAVKALNASEMFGEENELQFQLDSRTQRMLIRVVNPKTGEVVSQLPPEYVLRLAAELPR
ncbi:MAG: flagellar protein FlaG, partial [Acidobacteriia bacterium]|nr:flagellar protein FlaG [Terriglobia bacterium]